MLVTRGAPTGGSALTAKLAGELGKPLLHIDLDAIDGATAAERTRAWIAGASIAVLNVAGPRASGCPGIARDVKQLVTELLR